MKIGLDTSVLIASIKRRGEKHHSPALELAKKIKRGGHVGIGSALVLIEFQGALATTKMPVEKVYEAELSVERGFNLKIMPYENYVDKTLDLILEFRDIKRRFGIGAADFHHIATSIIEGCTGFVTVDERHLLRNEVKEAIRQYVEILTPQAAADKL